MPRRYPIMKSKIVSSLLSVLLLLVKTSKCGEGDTDMMNVSDGITRNSRDDSMVNASDEDEDPDVINIRRMLHRDNDAVIVVWKMEKYEAVRADITDYSELATDKAYVILQGQSKVKPKDWKIFYWVGDNASEEDAVNAALFTYVLDSIVHPVVNFRREAEGQESPSFRAIFEFTTMERGQQELQMAWEESTRKSLEEVRLTNDEHNTRMILVEGTQTSTVKEVEFSISYLEREDVCVVAYNSQAVYVYCGRATMYDAQKEVAKKLARMIQQKSESTLRVMQIIKRSMESENEQPLTPLREEFERISKAMQNEKVGEWNQKRTGVGEKVDILMARIYQDKHDAVREEIGEKSPINLHPFKHDDSFVLDTCLRDVGMVVWLGHASEIDEREGAVQRVESLFRERTHCGPRPVTFVDETDKRIRSMRHKEKYMFSHLSSFVELMQKLSFSWEHFYELRELDGGVLAPASSSSEDDE